MQDEPAVPLRVLDLKLTVRIFEYARVADLSACLAVERRAIENHDHRRLMADGIQNRWNSGL